MPAPAVDGLAHDFIGSVLSPVLDEAGVVHEDGPLGAPAGEARLVATPVAAQSSGHLPRNEAAAVVRQIVEAMSATAGGGDEGIELKLNPEELGHLRFRMGQGEHGGLALTITAERAETLDLLRRHVDQLDRHLSELGYESTSFSFGEDRRGSRTRSPAAASGQPVTSEIAAAPPPPVTASGGLDIRL